MQQLEIKHLTPYLLFDLKCKIYDDIASLTPILFAELATKPDYLENRIVKPILRPLSDLVKEIEVDGERFAPYENLKSEYKTILAFSDAINKIREYRINEVRYGVIQKLIEWHFDVFGLIEKGLALDINTVDLCKS